ncbi:MAG: GNAT family N-acetyltransferase [Actinomycetales bacterium]
MNGFESDVVGAPPPMVRDETPHDRPAVADLLGTAFRRTDVSDLVDRLRSADVPGARGLLAVRSERRPGADMSAVGAGEVVGYLRLTPARTGTDEVLVLAPLAVAPGARHHGVGTYLVQFAVEMVADEGYAAVVTPYDETFLDQFGFLPARESGVTAGDGGRLRVAPLRGGQLRGDLAVPEPLAPLLARS